MARGGGTFSRLPLAAGLLALVASFLGSCAEPRRAPRTPFEGSSSRVDVFLSATSSSPRLRMVIDDIRLVGADGKEHGLELARSSILAEETGSRIALAGATVPPDRYRAVVIDVSRATLQRDGQEIALRLLPSAAGNGGAPDEASGLTFDRDGTTDAVSYRIPVDLRVGRRHAASLFLAWNVEASLHEGAFRPVFSPSLEFRQARLGLLYVTDAATGSVLAFDRARERVVGTGKVGTAPRALAISRDRRRLFVVNEGDGSLTILDTRRNLADWTVPIRMGARTSDVALDEADRLVVTSNPGLDTVSFFDLRNGSRTGDVRVGRTPIRLVVAPSLRRAYVINSRSNDVSVIELGTRTVVATVPVEFAPSAIAIGRTADELYVGHQVSLNLLVLKAESMLLVDTIHVGGDVTAVLADRRRDRLYVARSKPLEIAVVDRQLAAVVRRIPISGVIENLAQPIEGSVIYGACPERGGLVVVDVVVGEEKRFLPCGTTPTDVIAID